MRFEVDGPAFAQEGDEIEIGDPIRRGVLVWFDRVEPKKLVMRVVTGAVEGVCYRIDPVTEPDVLRLVAEEQKDAQRIWQYYDTDWRIQNFDCPDCGWCGNAKEMAQELFSELMDFSCPSCDRSILIISYPTLKEIKQAAESGNIEAIAQLRGTRDN